MPQPRCVPNPPTYLSLSLSTVSSHSMPHSAMGESTDAKTWQFVVCDPALDSEHNPLPIARSPSYWTQLPITFSHSHDGRQNRRNSTTRPWYRREEIAFVWHCRVKLRKSWIGVAKAFNLKFPHRGRQGTDGLQSLQSRFYRFRKQCKMHKNTPQAHHAGQLSLCAEPSSVSSKLSNQ